MAKNKDLVLDDYIEDDYDYEIDYDYGKDESDFIEDYDEEKYAAYEAKSESKNNEIKKKDTKEFVLSETASTIVTTLTSFSNIFGIMGMVIAAVLILFFIFTLQFDSLVLYLVVLIISFFFGYGFMYFLDYFTSNN